MPHMPSRTSRRWVGAAFVAFGCGFAAFGCFTAGLLESLGGQEPTARTWWFTAAAVLVVAGCALSVWMLPRARWAGPLMVLAALALAAMMTGVS